jgi:hypothetical protein
MSDPIEKPPRFRRKRGEAHRATCQVRHFTLSEEAHLSLNRQALERRMSRSHYLETLILTDYRRIFRLFVELRDDTGPTALARVVSETGLAPSVVREMWTEFEMGLKGKPIPVAPDPRVEAERLRLRTAEVERETHARDADARELAAVASSVRSKARAIASVQVSRDRLSSKRSEENTKRLQTVRGR